MKRLLILAFLALSSRAIAQNGETLFAQLPRDMMLEVITKTSTNAKTLQDAWPKMQASLVAMLQTNKLNKAVLQDNALRRDILFYLFKKYPQALTTPEGNNYAIKIANYFGLSVPEVNGNPYVLALLLQWGINPEDVGPVFTEPLYGNCKILKSFEAGKKSGMPVDSEKYKEAQLMHEFLYQSMMLLIEAGFKPNTIAMRELKACEALLKD